MTRQVRAVGAALVRHISAGAQLFLVWAALHALRADVSGLMLFGVGWSALARVGTRREPVGLAFADEQSTGPLSLHWFLAPTGGDMNRNNFAAQLRRRALDALQDASRLSVLLTVTLMCEHWEGKVQGQWEGLVAALVGYTFAEALACWRFAKRTELREAHSWCVWLELPCIVGVGTCTMRLLERGLPIAMPRWAAPVAVGAIACLAIANWFFFLAPAAERAHVDPHTLAASLLCAPEPALIGNFNHLGCTTARLGATIADLVAMGRNELADMRKAGGEATR